MMDVYIVLDMYDETLVGVYDSREKAVEAAVWDWNSTSAFVSESHWDGEFLVHTAYDTRVREIRKMLVE